VKECISKNQRFSNFNIGILKEISEQKENSNLIKNELFKNIDVVKKESPKSENLFKSPESLAQLKVKSTEINDITLLTHVFGKQKFCLCCNKEWGSLTGKNLPRIFLSYGYAFVHMKTELDTLDKRKDVAEKLDKLMRDAETNDSIANTPSYSPKDTNGYTCGGGAYQKTGSDLVWTPCSQSLPKFPLLIMEKIDFMDGHMFHNGECCINFIQKHYIRNKKVPDNIKKEIFEVNWNQSNVKKKYEFFVRWKWFIFIG